MRLLTLLIAGHVADLPTTTKGLVKFSQARAVLADVSARVGEYSFPLTLPATRRNQAIFGVDKLHAQGLNKFGPYSDYAYELRVGGQVFSGTFRLTSLKNGYTGSLIGEGLSWALLLGDKKLNELLFPKVSYDGSQLEAILAKNCDATDVQFPLVAFGNFFHPPFTTTLADGTVQETPCPPAAVLDWPLSVDDYPPGVYLVNVLKQIFAGIGWRLQGRELDSEFWRAVVLTCAGADVSLAWPWGALLPASATSAGTDCFSYYGAGPGTGYNNSNGGFFALPVDGKALAGDVFFLPLALPTVVSSPTRALDAAGASYTAPANGTYTFAWSATLASGHQVFDGPNMNSGDPFVSALMRPVGLGLVVRRGGQDYTGAEGGLCTGDPAVTPALDYAPGQDRVLTPQRLDVAGGSISDLALGAKAGTVSVYLETGDSVELATFARRAVFDGTNLLTGKRSEFVLHFSAVALACTAYKDDLGVSKTQLQPADFLPALAQKDLVKDFLLRTDGFILADAGRKVATLVSRAELSTAGGEPVDLSLLTDQRTTEYLPAAGAGVGSLVFSPVALSDDPLVKPTADIVTATIGPGDSSQAIASVFAPVGLRSVWLTRGFYVPIPTCSTKDILAQNRSEVQVDIKSQSPRLVRYTGPDPLQVVNFMQRTVPLGGATWDGALAWDGNAGAVATYYAGTIRRAVSGHLARVQAPLTPALYRQLVPGRRVYLWGARYTVEALTNYDPSDDTGGLAQLDLSREIL